MKKDWKGKKGYIILAFVGIVAFILVLIFLWPEKDKIIQSELIVILVCITGYYAIQTQRLVKQEKISLEEEKKKRTADFWRERLTEFHLPLKINLLKLEPAMKFKPFPVDEYIKTLSEIVGLMSKRYILSQELDDSLISFLGAFKFHEKRLELEEEEKEEIIKKSEELIKKVDIEIRIIEYKINEVYGFYIDEKLQNLIEKWKVEFKLNKR